MLVKILFFSLCCFCSNLMFFNVELCCCWWWCWILNAACQSCYGLHFKFFPIPLTAHHHHHYHHNNNYCLQYCSFFRSLYSLYQFFRVCIIFVFLFCCFFVLPGIFVVRNWQSLPCWHGSWYSNMYCTARITNIAIIIIIIIIFIICVAAPKLCTYMRSKWQCMKKDRAHDREVKTGRGKKITKK